jgi:amino acid transporter
MPIHAAYLVLGLSVTITCAVIGSTVAFSAITATATIATIFSYLWPIIARQTVGRKLFKPAKWNLGRWSLLLAIIASAYILYLVVVLVLSPEFPSTAVSPRSRPAYSSLISPANP